MGLTMTVAGSTGSAPVDFEGGNYTLRLDHVSDELPARCTYDETQRGTPPDQCLKEKAADWSFRIVDGTWDGEVVRVRITHARQFPELTYDADGKTEETGNVVWRTLTSERSTFGAYVRAFAGLAADAKLPPNFEINTNAWIGRTIRAWVDRNDRGYFKVEKPKAVPQRPQATPARRPADDGDIFGLGKEGDDSQF